MRWIDLRFHCLLAQFLPFLVFFFFFFLAGGRVALKSNPISIPIHAAFMEIFMAMTDSP